MSDQAALINDLQRENAALRESAARYRAVFETISDFAYIVQVQPDGTRQPEWVTPITSRLIGYDPATMLQADSWQKIVHPDDWPIAQRQIDNLLANHATTAEYRLVNATGEIHWVLDFAQPEWDAAQQRVSRIYGALQDITERKLTERNLELLAQAGRELSTTLDLRAIYTTLHGLIRRAMPCAFLFVSNFGADDQLIRCVYGCGPQGEFDVQAFPPIPLEAEGRGTQSLVIRSGEPLVLNDYVAYLKTANTTYYVTEDGQLEPDSDEDVEDPPRSALIVPLKLKGQVVGVLQVFSTRLDDYAPRDLQFLESLAVHVSTALTNAHLFARAQNELAERRRVETALRQSEERYRALFDNMTEGFALHELVFDETGQPYDYRFLSINRAFEQLTGLKRESLIGQLQGQVIPDEDPYWFKTYCTVALTGEPVHLGHHSPALHRDFEVFAYCPAPNQFAVIFSDVTERKHAEQQLRLQGAALEAAANGIIITDRAGTIEWANPAFTTLTGYALDEVIGRNPRDLIRSGQQPREFYRNLWDTILGGQVWNGEIVNRRKDGRLYVEETTITPVRIGSDDHISHFVAIKQDITARRQVDLALRQYAERLQTLHEIDRGVAVAQSPRETAQIALRHLRRLVPSDLMSVMLLDKNTRQPIVLAAFTNQPDEQFTDLRFVIPAAALEPFERNEVVLINDTAADTQPVTGPVSRNLQANGIRAYMTAPLIVEDELIGLLNVGSATPFMYDQDHLDIIRELGLQLAIAIHQARLREQIQRHAAELEARVTQRTSQLAAANERLQELDSLKSKFVSEVSHELRTPVTSLLLYLSLLGTGKPDKYPQYLKQASQQAARMKQLIEDILDLSRLERDKADLTLGPIDLNAVLEQAAMAQLPRAAAAALNVTVDLATDLPAARGDINRLQQVATNLIANAINYTAKGEVRIRSFQQPDQARVGFEVQDTGMGIAPEDLPHLFERFYRGQRASQSSVRGTGLGLSIVKEIVDWHGGEVEVCSEVGVGSTFTVWLPVAQSDLAHRRAG